MVGGGGNPLSVEIWIPDEDEAFTRGTENKEAVVKENVSSCRLSGRIDKRAYVNISQRNQGRAEKSDALLSTLFALPPKTTAISHLGRSTHLELLGIFSLCTGLF